MLINTVILFLRDILPLFFMFSLLLLLMPGLSLRWLFGSIGAGVLAGYILVNMIDLVSEWFQGAGMEISMFILHGVVYAGVLYLAYYNYAHRHQPHSGNTVLLAWISGILLVVTMMLDGTSFLVYFNSFWDLADNFQALLLGTILGLGICLSLTVLFYFIVNWLNDTIGNWSAIILMFFYAAGQWTGAISLLAQVDLLPPSSQAWDTSHVLADGTELAHLLNVLFGYEAAPSYLQLYFYLLMTLLPMLTIWVATRRRNKVVEKHYA